MQNRIFSAAIGDSDRGISTVFGVVVITVIIFASVLVVVGFGSAAIADTQQESALDRAEHSMTLLDSRTAMVALGSADTQTLTFGLDDGRVETDPSEGWLAIDHGNYTAGRTETVFNASLGSVTYRNGESRIAYQGGGVWRLDGEGDAWMLSPPEFHYRGATLTLPVVRVVGEAGSATSPRARIGTAGDARLIFPNATTGSQNATGAPYNATEAAYENPVRNGTVTVRVRSPYYEAWAAYARERTTANVTVFDHNETVHLVLQSIGGSIGNFDMPLEGERLRVSGIASGHPIKDFELTLAADNNFQNGHWSLYSTSNSDEFEMHVFTQGKCTGGSYNDDVGVSLYYYNASTGEVREWQNASITPGPGTAVQVDCSSQELDINFTDTDTTLAYGDIDTSGSDNKWCFGTHIANRDSPEEVTLDQHPSVDGPITVNETEGDTATMNYTVNHYVSRMGMEFDLTVKDGPGNSECLSPGNGQGSSRVDESASFGRFTFEETTAARFITYLHVTENRVRIELN
jgi:hypothetical protein